MADVNKQRDGEHNVPVPDPSKLTTDAISREVQSLRDVVQEQLSSVVRSNSQHREILETRLDGMDKAIQLLQSTSDKFPARIDEKITALREVTEQKSGIHLEKFASVQTQFGERDVRTEQAAGAVKIAVDAALQAQKEAASEQSKSNQAATAKSEASTAKQIDALGMLFQNMTKTFDDKIADVKDRITRVEGGWGGAAQVIGYVIAAIGILIGLSRFIQ